MDPDTKKYAKGILVMMGLSFICGIIYMGVSLAYVANHIDDLEGSTSEEIEAELKLQFGDMYENATATTVGATVAFILSLIFSFLTIVFACLYTFKR